jgi:transcriptional regulator of acetoin/glycerol metabolism
VDIPLIKAAVSGFQTAQIREEEEEDREEIERKEIMEALRRTKGSRQDAAELLGISTTTLWRKIRKYGIRL